MRWHSLINSAHSDQWAGEKISSRDKTIAVEDELRDLEQDVELRKQGIARYAHRSPLDAISMICAHRRLQAASEAYFHVLSKKKESPSSGEAEKLMPIDALGIVMVTHGEEYGDDSAFGACRASRSWVANSALDRLYRDVSRCDGQGSLQDSYASRGIWAYFPGYLHRIVREACSRYQGLRTPA